MSNNKSSALNPRSRTEIVHFWVITVLQLIMALGLFSSIYQQHWFDAAMIAGIIVIMRAPVMVGRHYRLIIPPEWELMAVIFVFAALFLGEIRDYYDRFWWWDIALHTTSGFLLGILGFLLVYVLNEDSRINLKMQPRFVALFAFIFAVAIGVFWEIFEFIADRLAGTTMQKPMLGDPSGLTDTMWDLIVDVLGAATISVTGWWHMEMRRHSIFDAWIARFVARNRHLFRDTRKRS